MYVRILFLAILIAGSALAQTTSFDVEAYKQFLQSHQNMTTGELLSLHPAGTFQQKSAAPSLSSLYLDSIILKYNLSSYEQSLINDHGFMVSESLGSPSFGAAYLDIWHKDLPVFVSTDALLHALHSSYDVILKDVERTMLIPKLDSLLRMMHGQLNALHAAYSTNLAMEQKLKDVDVYLTVSRVLLKGTAVPYYATNSSIISTILSMIQDEQVAEYPLFASSARTIDFSQFKVRGHYTESEELGRYFKAMMWLGRTEIYLLTPRTTGPAPGEDDVQRQIIDAVLLSEAVQGANALPLYNQIDSMIEFFVGEPDNVTLPNVQELLSSVSVTSADQLLDTNIVKRFQDSLVTKSYAFQRILSQILYNDPMNPDEIRPASSFLLLGQRFIIDSYVTGQVVYDKILYNGVRITRMLPSTLDILFALGNNGAAQLLQPELDTYHYGSNLVAARYLVDAYDSSFWQSNLFNLWLNCIRTLNPPHFRDSLPAFMQTAAWWQEKMNTQLASWTELRHDNLLYAKQSYSGGAICSYPYGYVEPIPEFYDALIMFATIAENRFQSMLPIVSWERVKIVQYFQQFKATAETLGVIARKELQHVELTDAEHRFLRTMIFTKPDGCTTGYGGWYFGLYIDGEDGFFKKDYLVADVHTAPTDASGNPIGWVVHAGTGEINLGVFTAENSLHQMVAYVGPTMSYREFTTTNFLRLSDEEWKSDYVFRSTRPSFVNLYLSDSSGNSKGGGINLLMSPNGIKPPSNQPDNFVLYQNYPNPFNAGTLIRVTVPSNGRMDAVKLAIYNSAGQEIRKLLNLALPSGNYLFRWDGKDDNGRDVASGIYFYELHAGDQIVAKKMSLIR